MPKRPPKPAKKKQMRGKDYGERQKARYLAKPANYLHIIALNNRINDLEKEVARTNFNLSAIVAILDKKRVRVPGLKFFRKGQRKAMAAEYLREAKEQLEKERAEAQKKRAQEDKQAHDNELQDSEPEEFPVPITGNESDCEEDSYRHKGGSRDVPG